MSSKNAKTENSKKPTIKEKVEKSKFLTIGNFAAKLILAESSKEVPTKSVTDITNEVKKKFPNCKTTNKCTSWYLAQMRKDGSVDKFFRLIPEHLKGQ